MELLKDKIDFLKKCDTSDVADSFIRMGLYDKMKQFTVDNTLCGPLNRNDKFTGLAMTVEYGIPDSKQKTWNMFDLISISNPNTVFVMSGCDEYCYTGDVYVKYASSENMGAFVVEGFVRDIAGIITEKMPVFCKGGTTAAKGGAGHKIISYNKPLSFHNRIVNPGDIIKGDADGLVIIPQRFIDDVVYHVKDILEVEKKFIKVFEEGTNILERLRDIAQNKGISRK